MRLNRRHILILIFILVVVSLFLPIHVRYNFVSSAKIFPKKEWKLYRGADEGFYSQTYNYRTDALGDLVNYRFERGDIAVMKIREDLCFDTLVSEKDTIACIESFFIENEISRLYNQREVELANKKVLSTGEKQALVEEASRRYTYAQQQLDLEKKNFARQEFLFRDSVITPAEYDVYQNSLKLAEINTEVAHSELQAILSGEKDPVIEKSERQISSYENEIARLEAQKAQYTILPPFQGILTYDTSQEGILKVSDNQGLVLRIPVPYRQASYLNSLHAVTFSTPDNKITLGAEFEGFEENVCMIQGQQFVIAKAVTKGSTRGIYPGMIVSCRIFCDKVTLFEFLKRNFTISF